MPLPWKRAQFLFSEPNRRLLSVLVWLELAAGLISAMLVALALLSPHWMEQVAGLSPDAGDGSAEYGMALLWAAVSILMFALAGRTGRKHAQRI
jgi:hypothetical protein